MAQLALGIAGAAVGSFFGPLGASIGWSLGSAVGGMLFQKTEKVSQEGPRLQDLRVQVATYGIGIPIVYGTARLAGNIIWCPGIREVVTRTTEEVGGKGGPPESEVTTTTYTYFVDMAVAICAGEIAGVRRIWADGRLIYNVGDDASLESILQSNAAAGDMRFYTGSETQTADPTMEASLGAGNVPGHRGLAYVVFNNFSIDAYGRRIPNLTFEVVSAASAADLATTITHTDAGTANGYIIAQHPQAVAGFVQDTGVSGNPIKLINTATGALIAEKSWASADLLTIGSASLTLGQPAYDPDGNVWVFCYGSISGYLGGWLLGLRENGEPFRLVFAYTYLGGGLNISLVIDRDGYAYFCPVGNTMYRIQLSTAPDYELPPPTPSSTHIETVSTTLQPYTARGFSDREGNAAWLWYDATVPAMYFVTIEHSTPQRVEIAGYNTTDSYSGVNALQFDLNNDPWVAWYSGSGGTRRAHLKRFNRETGVVVQTIDLPLSASGGLQSFVFGNDGFLYVLYLGVWRKYEISGGTNIYSTTSGWSFWGAAVETQYAIIFGSATIAAGHIYVLEPLPRLTLGATPGLDDVVTDICAMVGLTAADLDVTSLTDSVDGYVVPRPMTARAAIEPLQRAYFFDAVESDLKLKFVTRGGAAVVAISEDDLDAREFGQAPGVPLSISRAHEAEVPKQITVNYWNKNAAYEEATEYARRLISAAEEQIFLELPLALTATKAAQVADVILYTSHMERTRYQFRTGVKYARYEPTDVVTIPSGSATHMVRLVSKTEEGMRIAWEAVAENAPLYSSAAEGATDQDDDTVVGFPGPTELLLLDIPLLRSEDDDAGFYAAMGSVMSGWRGATLMGSSDDAAFEAIGAVTSSAAIGYALTALGTAVCGNAFDESFTVDVALDSGTLSSATQTEVLNGANCCLLGSEILQFTTATLHSGENRYTLSGMLRGRRGTERFLGSHITGERFVLLNGTGLLRVTRPTTEIDVTRYYRAVSFGSSLTVTFTRSLANTAAGLKPLQVVHTFGTRHYPATNDWTINWVRRGRVDWDWRDRVDVPIGETSESYEVDVMNTTTGLSVRTLTATTNTVTYTAAQQTTDFGGAQTTITVRIYQISATIGRGYEKEVTF